MNKYLRNWKKELGEIVLGCVAFTLAAAGPPVVSNLVTRHKLNDGYPPCQIEAAWDNAVKETPSLSIFYYWLLPGRVYAYRSHTGSSYKEVPASEPSEDYSMRV